MGIPISELISVESEWQDSNLQPAAYLALTEYKSAALPIELHSVWDRYKLERHPGAAPGSSDWKSDILAAGRMTQNCSRLDSDPRPGGENFPALPLSQRNVNLEGAGGNGESALRPPVRMVPMAGFAPATSGLTTALRVNLRFIYLAKLDS